MQSNATHTQVRRARAVLEVNGTRHPLQPPGLVVGRGTEADLRINDPGVSRRHVEFDVRSDVQQGEDDLRLEVHDLGSTNGMLVDGHKVTKAGAPRRQPGPDRQHHDDRPDPRGRRGRSGLGEPVSELTLFLIRFAYLAILWIFVLSAISVIRSDMFGARVPEAARGADAAQGAARPPRQPPKRRGSPDPRRSSTEGSNAGERADLDAARRS